MIDASTKIVPGHGTLFVADSDADLPGDPLTAFTLTGTPPTGWTNIGHTSKDNLPAFKRDGGDATNLDSWLADNIDTIYASTQWGLSINPIQIDEDALDLAFNGFFDTDGGYVIPASNNGTTKQLYLLMTDGTGKLGFYIANASVNIGDAPGIDTTKFFEVPLSAQILAADEAMIPAAADGTPGIMKVYKSGLVASAPVIDHITPATGVHGTQYAFEIVGEGFTGVTGAAGVKFGTTNCGVGNYFVIDDEHISGITPVLGAAGADNVVVTHPTTGASNAVVWTAT